MLRSIVDKFLTMQRESFILCLAEPFQEKDVQHVKAEPTAPEILQPPQPPQVAKPPIIKSPILWRSISGPHRQILSFPLLRPCNSYMEHLFKKPLRFIRTPLNSQEFRRYYQQTQMIRTRMADRNVRSVILTVYFISKRLLSRCLVNHVEKSSSSNSLDAVMYFVFAHISYFIDTFALVMFGKPRRK